jgi:hypothetical protein
VAGRQGDRVITSAPGSLGLRPREARQDRGLHARTRSPNWRQSRLKPPTRFATLGGFVDRGVNLLKGRPRSATVEIATCSVMAPNSTTMSARREKVHEPHAPALLAEGQNVASYRRTRPIDDATINLTGLWLRQYRHCCGRIVSARRVTASVCYSSRPKLRAMASAPQKRFGDHWRPCPVPGIRIGQHRTAAVEPLAIRPI